MTSLTRGVAGLAAVLAAGALVGRAAAGTPSEPEPVRAVTVGAATVEVPSDWRPDRKRADRVEFVTGEPDLERVILVFGEPADASLVPSGLRGTVGKLGRRARPARLAGYRAWSYTGRRSADQRPEVALTVLPSGRGVLAVACLTAAPGPAATCASRVRTVDVRAAAILAPAANLALRLQSPRVLSELDAARMEIRGRLVAARTTEQQRRLAGRLAGEHRTAFAALRSMSPPGEALPGALAGAAQAYDGLAGAVGGEDLTARRAAVDVADDRVDAAVSRLAGDPAIAQRRPVVATVEERSTLPALLALAAVGLLCALLLPARRRTPLPQAVVEPEVSVEPEVAAHPAELARRRPMAPPPTLGRWDQPPISEQADAGDRVAS